MFESPATRALGLVVLFGALFGMLAWYGTYDPAPALGDYPNSRDFVASPDRYVGQAVTATGTVTGTDPVTIELVADPGVDYVVRDVPHSVAVGERLRVFGTLVDPGTIRAQRSFVVPPWGLPYAYGISFLAGLWALARLLGTWRFDRETLALVPRSRPLTLGSLLGDSEPGGSGSGGDRDDGGRSE